MKKLALFIALFSVSVFAAGADVKAMLEQATTDNDASLHFLSMIFGSLNGMLPDSNVMIIPIIVKYFNFGLIIYLSLIISYSVSNSIIKTASQGKLLGKQGGGSSALFRTITASATLTPIPNYGGFSLMQIIMIKIIITGVGLANSVWGVVTDYVTANNSVLPKSATSSNKKFYDYKSSGEINLNKILYCIAYNDSLAARDPNNDNPGYGVIIEPKNNAIEVSSYYKDCGKLAVFIKSNGDNLSSKSYTFNSVKNHVETVKKIADQAVYYVQSKTNMPNQYEILKYSYEIMFSKIASENLQKQGSTPGLDWDTGWIYAGAQFRNLINYSNKLTGSDASKIMVNMIVGEYNGEEYNKRGFTTFAEALKKPLLPPSNIRTREENDTTLDDIYLKSILSIVPISPENYKLRTLQRGLPIPQKTEQIKATIIALEALNAAEVRGNKSLSMGGGISDILLSVFDSGWGLGMFFAGNYDDSKGPLNIVERDRVITRDIQILVFKIYNAWLELMPSKYRSNSNPIERTRDFGLAISEAGMEFFINVTQDTFFASMGAQLSAMNEGMKYTIKGAIVKGASGITNWIAGGINPLTYIPIVNIAAIPAQKLVQGIAAIINGVGSYYTMMAKFPQLYTPLVVASRLMYLSFALAAAIPPIVLGLLFAIYVPFVPFIIFLFSAIGWLITVIESVIAAPIVAAGMAKPHGHDFLGKAQQIVMMLAAVFIRPVCILIGFVFAILLYNVASVVLDYVYFPFIKQYVATSVLGQSSGMAISILLIMMLYGYLVIAIIRYCFSLTYLLPSYVVRWIGLAPISGGEEESMESVESSMKEALSTGLQGASTGVSSVR